MDLKNAWEQFGLKYSIIIPHNIIGVGQNIFDRYRNVAAIFIRQAMTGHPITIFGDGSQRRAFSDINCYMDMFTKLMSDDHNQEVFNIGGDQWISIKDLADIVISEVLKLGIDCQIKHEFPRHEVRNAWCDHTKAKKVLGFQDHTDIRETICQMINWFCRLKRREPKYKEYEIEKGIYPVWRKLSS